MDNKALRVLRDDGTAKNLLPRKDFPGEKAPKQWFVSAFGTKSLGMGPVNKDLHAAGEIFPAEFYVADVDQPLVGRNFINRYEMTTDPHGGVYAKRNGKTVVLKKPDQPANNDLPE